MSEFVTVKKSTLEKLVEPGRESSVTDAEWSVLRAVLAQEAGKVDCCANCMRPEREHSENKCPLPNSTVWHAWDYDFKPNTSPPAPVSVAPEGWKLVPIEATRPMLRAFIAGGCSRSSYRDMIAAAPILEPVLADRSTFAEQLEKDIDIHGNYLPGVTCELLFDLGYRKSAPPAPFEFGWDCKSNDGREHRVIGDYCVACLDKVKGLNQ